MKNLFFLFIYINFHLISFSQSLSENDIKQLAQKINAQLQGKDIGNGITVRSCFALGRTWVYQYDVAENWYPPENMKEELIANLKKAGYSEVYYKNNVNVDFHYYFGNSLREKISIKWSELSNLNFSLDDFISIDGHPKAKGVNLKIKQPNGWQLKEGDRPNIVKKFVYQNNSYAIMVKDNYTFVSRNEAKELLADDKYLSELVSEVNSTLKNSEILNQRIVTIDKYPTLEITIKGEMERSGIKLRMIMKSWIIYYEDKFVFLQCGGIDDKEFEALEGLYNLITNSVIFPEQYNY